MLGRPAPPGPLPPRLGEGGPIGAGRFRLQGGGISSRGCRGVVDPSPLLPAFCVPLGCCAAVGVGVVRRRVRVLRVVGSVCRWWGCRSRCRVSSWEVRVDDFELDACVAEHEPVGGFFGDLACFCGTVP